ncbi:extracellular solute-binding protein [Halosimplex rubrum]|uniref:Extracellular solute-binding protein n=1 Tax=Halosimplex rubrum TaxID=869889 RepID=A0A7D5PAH5_9EURY|nr:extracellular solute-binding protein [Halosimplex rubrum]QLH78300.1 extracellular solute-binding protein [Halosimplex rubrum]
MSSDGTQRKRSRRNVLKGLGLAGVTGLAGCGSNGSNGSGGTDGAPGTVGDQSVEITFWDYFGGTENEEIEALVADFEEEHSNITVSSEAVPFDEFVDNLFTSVASGNAPHVASYWMSFSTFLEAEGVIDPIDEYLSEGLDPYYDIVEPAATVGDSTYALPMDVHAHMLVTNDTVMEEAGAETPTNFEEFKTAANAIQENTDARPFPLLQDNSPIGAMRYFYGLLLQHEGASLVEDGEPVYHENEGGQRSAEFMDQVTDEFGWDQTSLSDAQERTNLFLDDQVGMMFVGNWQANNFENEDGEIPDDLEFTYHRPYVFPGEARRAWAESNGFFFPTNDSHTETEKQAAVQFVEYITQNNPLWAQTAGHLPATPEVAESEEVTSSPRYEEYDIVSTLAGMAEDGELVYQPPLEFDMYATDITNPLVGIYSQDSDPQDALDQSANAFSSRMS